MFTDPTSENSRRASRLAWDMMSLNGKARLQPPVFVLHLSER